MNKEQEKPQEIMTHTDTDIAEILERFDEDKGIQNISKGLEGVDILAGTPGGSAEIIKYFKDFITRECLALKKKWEREKADNQ